MIFLDDLFPADDLQKAIDEGYVRVQTHPTLPYCIYNYTEKAAFAAEWNSVTKQCRGLIVNSQTNEVIARPLRKFMNASEPGAYVPRPEERAVVTEKQDGCLQSRMTLALWGGGTIPIGDVVRKRLPVTLVGMNEEGEMVPAPVIDWHNNGTKNSWIDIHTDAPVSRVAACGKYPNRLRVTLNHHVAVGGNYIPACDLRVGDVLTTQTWAPDENAIRLIRASLLGDGCVTPSLTRPDQSKYQESHSDKQEAYVLTLRKALGSCVTTRTDSISGYGSRLLWVGSREYRALGRLRYEWYPDGVKCVPKDLSWMDDFAVAKWHMDDGHRQRFSKQADRIAFSTHSFNEIDILRLGDRLAEMYGISYHLVNDSGRGLVLIINSGRKQQIHTLWEAIAPHVHPSMRYKVPDEYQDVPYIEMTPATEIVMPAEARVISIHPVAPTKKNFSNGRVGFDVTTTTHNYLARGVLVHNSLAIGYPTDVSHAIATRGSFSSVQAAHATKLWQERYEGHVTIPRWITPLWEVIYPENRIVCDNGDFDDLVLLGAVDISTGRSYTPEEAKVLIGWPGPVTETHPFRTLAEALAAPPRDNHEGYVLHFPESDERLKIKHDRYVELHKLVFGMNERVIWEHLGEGRPLDDLLSPLPEEFHPWINSVAERLITERDRIACAAEKFYQQILGELPEDWTRKDFALKALQCPVMQPYLFHLLDGRDPRPAIWKTLRPSGAVTMTATEDAA